MHPACVQKFAKFLYLFRIHRLALADILYNLALIQYASPQLLETYVSLV